MPKSDGLAAEVRAELLRQPWAMRPERLAALVEALRACEQCDYGEGGEPAAARTQSRPAAGSVAVIPVFGIVTQHPTIWEMLGWGGASTDRIGAAFTQAVNDPAVGAIVLQIDSPGGGVYGVAELGETILKARGSKPIVAVADAEAASAAYWIASAADEISVTPSGMVGSIGVWTMHQDVSRMVDDAGVTISLISAGRYKVEGNPFEPLSEEARAAIQADVDEYYGLFVKAVAKGRGVKEAEVREGFGEGRMVTAQAAVKLGMADRVETLAQAVARLAGNRSARNGAGAEGQAPAIAAGADLDLRRRRHRLRSH